ncbi:MAG: dimethylhistidine N-methyltransferase [Oleiphilaceae bacterium]|jgi:dimethylhistidine N-methyltransferase
MSKLATTALTENVFFKNQHPGESDSRTEILAGLNQKQKTINPKYFYDTHGSELFERITKLPEYYPSRTERSLYLKHADAIAEYCGKNCVMIEPGSGSSEKIRLLLESLKLKAYVPMDIAKDFLQRSALKLGKEFSWLNIHAVCADFGIYDEAPEGLPEGKRVIFYPGSTLGNMTPEAAKQFLTNLRPWLGHDGGMLIGIDLHKSTDTLTAAYNDSEGVTAAFNLNALSHINQLVNSNFDLRNFSHRAFYNLNLKRIEMHLESHLDHIVKVGESAIAFAEGETIHTENSYKYTQESFENLAEGAGFKVRQSWFDDKQLFGVHYLD